MDDRDTLLKEIGEVSFFLDDLRLYLDTHPQEERALQGENTGPGATAPFPGTLPPTTAVPLCFRKEVCNHVEL